MNAENILQNTNTSLASRQAAARLLETDPDSLKQTIRIITQPQELSLIALMVIEVYSRNNFNDLKEYVPKLIMAGKLYSDSSSRRCLAKMYNLALQNHYNSISFLPEDLKREILELSFSWLIANEQTAVKVFSMQNIFELRTEQKWIPLELKGILEKDIVDASAGYKSRATKILRKL